MGRIDDPIALGPFWAAFEAWSDAERAQAIGPVMNKLRAFLLRRRLRNVIGQAEPRLDLDQALATNGQQFFCEMEALGSRWLRTEDGGATWTAGTRRGGGRGGGAPGFGTRGWGRGGPRAGGGLAGRPRAKGNGWGPWRGMGRLAPLISPPVGVNVFVVKGFAEDVPMRDIFAGILPFWGAMLVCLLLLVLFFLPGGERAFNQAAVIGGRVACFNVRPGIVCGLAFSCNHQKNREHDDQSSHH